MRIEQLTIGLVAGVAAFAWVVLASPTEVAAQACCTATGAGEFSVVGRCQESSVGMKLSYTRAMGTFDEDGNYTGLRRAGVDDATLSLGGGTRIIHRSLQVYGSLPLRLQHRDFSGMASTTSFGFGDAAAAVRWTALDDVMEGLRFDDSSTLVPFLDVYSGVKAPTGRAPDSTRVATGSDIMGDGSWKVFGGVKLSKFLAAQHVVGLSGQYSYAFVHRVERADSQMRIRPGPSWIGGATYQYIPNVFWSAGLTSTYQFEQAFHEDSVAVPESSTKRLSFGAHVTHGFGFPFWEATFSVEVDSWWNGAGANVPFAGPTASLTLRRQWL
jgi:hypothetical protein